MLKNWRRRRVLARRSIPEALWTDVVAATPVLAALLAEAAARLRMLALLFLHEKRIEPAAGLEVDERMRVLLAALACVPILDLSLD